MHLIKKNIQNMIVFIYVLLFSNCQAQSEKVFNISKSGYNYYPVISPNEKYIAYFQMVDEDMGAVGNLWIYDIQNNVRTKLSKLEHYEAFDSYPNWTSDSKYIVFSSGSKIYSINIHNKKVEELFSTESKETSIFAPNISPDGKKIAFWILFKIGVKIYHSVWIWDMDNQEIIRLPDMEYGASTEVVWYKPEWTSDSKNIIATYFPPSKEVGYIVLKNIDIITRDESIISESLYSSYFQVKNFEVYYTKIDEGKPSLFVYNIKKGEEKYLFRELNGVFTVCNNKEEVFFSYDNSLYSFKKDKVSKLNISGTNPQMISNLFLYEKWSENKALKKNTIVGVNDFKK